MAKNSNGGNFAKFSGELTDEQKSLAASILRQRAILEQETIGRFGDLISGEIKIYKINLVGKLNVIADILQPQQEQYDEGH